MICKICKLNYSSTLLLLYFYLASTLLLQNIHLTPANPISVLDQLVHHFQTKRDDLSVFPRAGTFVPRLGTFVPRPGTNVPQTGTFIPQTGTFIPRRGTIWEHCLLGILWKKLWEMMIDLTSLVIVVEKSESLSRISTNFFPKYRENSRWEGRCLH